MILCDSEIREAVGIAPFSEKSQAGGPSFGLGSMGYDFRLGYEFVAYDRQEGTHPYLRREYIIDPMNWNENAGERFTANVGDQLIMPGGAFWLAVTVEHVTMPDDVLAECVGKSTYARCGVNAVVTPLEPGWRGRITLELVNNNPNPVAIYPGFGIIQAIFHRGNKCERSYTGVYQDQPGLMGPKVRVAE